MWFGYALGRVVFGYALDRVDFVFGHALDRAVFCECGFDML